MLTSDFYILSWDNLVFVDTEVYVTKILFDVKFFVNHSMRGYGNDIQALIQAY